MKKFFLIMTFCAAVFSAYAQSNKTYDDLVVTFKQAATEHNDSARLALYDAIVQSFGVATIGQTAESPSIQTSSKWIFDQNVDPLTDNKKYFFMLKADSGKNDYGDLPALVIRQDGDELELYINWHTYLGNDTDDYKYEAKYITTRVDQDQPITLLWRNSTDSKASFCPYKYTRELVQRLGRASQFVARCTPYGDSPITAVFDVRGLKEISMPYNDQLGWWE